MCERSGFYKKLIWSQASVWSYNQCVWIFNSLQQQKKTVEGISKLLANKHLVGLKCAVPASFILSQEMDPKSMPLMPSNPDFWDDYLLKVYTARLSSVLQKEKIQFNEEVFEPHDRLKPKLLDHLEMLNKFLNCPSLHSRRHPFPNCIIRLRKVISETISDKLY